MMTRFKQYQLSTVARVDPEIQALELVLQRRQYLAVAERVGAQFPFMNDDFDPADSISLQLDGDVTTIRINGPIHPYFGVDVRDIISQLDNIQPSQIRMLIESPGGLAADGLALYLDLRARSREGAQVHTETRGIVASAAALIYLGGDERSLFPGSMFMIHHPRGGAIIAGMHQEMRRQGNRAADDVEAMQTNFYQIYQDRLPQISRNDLDTWLNNERLLNATEASDAGIGELVQSSDDDSDTQDSEPTAEQAQEVIAVAEDILSQVDLVDLERLVSLNKDQTDD